MKKTLLTTLILLTANLAQAKPIAERSFFDATSGETSRCRIHDDGKVTIDEGMMSQLLVLKHDDHSSQAFQSLMQIMTQIEAQAPFQQAAKHGLESTLPTQTSAYVLHGSKTYSLMKGNRAVPVYMERGHVPSQRDTASHSGTTIYQIKDNQQMRAMKATVDQLCAAAHRQI